MYSLHTTKQFEKDYKLCLKRGFKPELIQVALEQLAKTGTLPIEYRPHKLRGNYVNYWECHIRPDWLLIWYYDKAQKQIHLVRTGTHSDLF